MKSWVKLYTEINRDPDFGTLTWAQRGIWSALLALAGEIDARDEQDRETGELDTLGKTAWRLRCEPGEFAEAVAAFVERGMVEERDSMLFLPHYGERQRRAPSSTHERVAERVQRHRDNKPAARNEDVTTLHEEVTSAQRGVTPSESDTESDRESETEAESDRDAEAAASVEPLAVGAEAGAQGFDSMAPEGSDPISDSDSDAESESVELEEAIERWSRALGDAAGIESNLTQMFKLWGAYKRVRACDMVRLVHDTGALVETMTKKGAKIGKPMAYFFTVVRQKLTQKMGMPEKDPEKVQVRRLGPGEYVGHGARAG